jgi:hypothetical protein
MGFLNPLFFPNNHYKMNRYLILVNAAILVFLISCKKNQESAPPGLLQLLTVKVGNQQLNLQGTTADVPPDSVITLKFSGTIDMATAPNSITLEREDQSEIPFTLFVTPDPAEIRMYLQEPLDYFKSYLLGISSGIKGTNGDAFPGAGITFKTVNGKMTVGNITLNGLPFHSTIHPRNISYDTISISVTFSHPIDSIGYQSYFTVSGTFPVTYSLSPDHATVTITNNAQLEDYTRYYFNISSFLKAENGFTFDGFSNFFYTELDSTPKFPLIPDEDLLTLIQQQTFRYFYDFAHPACGMARERDISGDIVTTGGSGFGIIALVVGMNRGFITREEGLTRLDKILGFLETCDRFHGAWPHWLNGSTGKTVPFTTQDNGADLVETGFMIEGLLTMRQYLDSNDLQEKPLINRINALYDGVEWDWFTRGQNVLYWHWSPDYGWAMNMRIEGYNETMIVYILAASSKTHAVSADAYHQGYARNGNIVNGNSFYGYILPLGQDYGGPLFFTHYSFLGLDPRNLSDQYANYWEQNVNQSLINFTHCKTNPKNFLGYSEVSWGLTACDNPWGYDAHSPTNDLGVIAPTAAVSALPYTPLQSMNAIRHFYYILGDRLWGPYGFYDAFDVTEGWWASSYIAIDEGPIVSMIENYRTALPWELFMSNPEIQQGLTKLGFSY